MTAQISGQNRGIAPSRYRSVAGQSPCKRPTEVRSHPTGTSSSEALTWTTSRLCRKSPRRWARNCSVGRSHRWGLAQRPVHPALTRATRVRISNPLPFRRMAQEGIAAFEAVLFGSTPKSASTRHRLPARPPLSQGGRVGFDPHWRDQLEGVGQLRTGTACGLKPRPFAGSTPAVLTIWDRGLVGKGTPCRLRTGGFPSSSLGGPTNFGAFRLNGRPLVLKTRMDAYKGRGFDSSALRQSWMALGLAPQAVC